MMPGPVPARACQSARTGMLEVQATSGARATGPLARESRNVRHKRQSAVTAVVGERAEMSRSSTHAAPVLFRTGNA
jgi:hypothetical protein